METVEIEIPRHLIELLQSGAPITSFIQIGAGLSTSFHDRGLPNPGDFDLESISCNCPDYVHHYHIVATHMGGSRSLYERFKAGLKAFHRAYIPRKVSHKGFCDCEKCYRRV